MQSRRDMIAIACETLHRLFSTNEDRLIKQASVLQLNNIIQLQVAGLGLKQVIELFDRFALQALDADMVPYLLNILDGRLDAVENSSMTKAQIVKALKAMTRSLLLGEKVTAILEKSPVWGEYKDQRHDLFITNSVTSGYLTGERALF